MDFLALKVEGEAIFGQKKVKKVTFLIFLMESKSIENEKILFPQMIKVCQKKFPPFKRKKTIFGHFCDFSKIKKTAQNRFFLKKHEKNFWHTLMI